MAGLGQYILLILSRRLLRLRFTDSKGKVSVILFSTTEKKRTIKMKQQVTKDFLDFSKQEFLNLLGITY